MLPTYEKQPLFFYLSRAKKNIFRKAEKSHLIARDLHFLAISLTSSEVGGSPVKTARSPARRGNASAAPWRPRSLPHEPRNTGSPSSRRCRAPGSPLHPTAPTAEASAAARISGEERSLLRVPATSRCRTMPSTAAAPAQPRLYGRSGTDRPRCAAGRRAKTRPHGTHCSRFLGGRTAVVRPESRSQPRVAAPPVASNGPERRPRCQRGPGPRVTHRLKCSMIFSSRTFSGKFPTQRCLVSRTMLGGVPATVVAGSPSPASYAAVSTGRRAPGRRRRRLRRWRRQRRRLLRLPPVQRPSLSPRF